MSLKNKSVLITGGAGFIGSHAADAIIKEGPDNLVIVDNFFLGKESNLNQAKLNYPKLKIYNQDASDYERMKEILMKECVDVVFDLAVVPLPVSLVKPRWGCEHNIAITLTICELIRNGLFKTLVHFSSSEAYGTSEDKPMDESYLLRGLTPYAASKAASDQIIYGYDKTFGIDQTIIRPFNNYGPRQNEGSYAGVIPITIKRILNGEAPVLFGDGKQTRDFLYVTDTARAAVAMYNNQNTRGKVLNIASGKERLIKDVIQLIAQLLNYDKPIIHDPTRPGDVRRHIANTYLAEDLLGFKPTISFEDGMRQTVEWYKENLKKIGGQNGKAV